jgi:hypothetical protein
MSEDGAPFDLEKYAIASEPAGARTVVVPRRIKKRQDQFAKVPRHWVDLLTRSGRDKTLAIVWHLLHEHWKQAGGPIKLSNGMLALDGVGRGAKWRALNKLESLGLISVERRDRKSPIVTIKAE